MASFVIPSIFTAIDKITAPIRNILRAFTAMGAGADAAAARADRAFRRVGNGADRAFKALNPLSKISAAAGFLGISVGAAGATSLIGKFIKEASKIEDATARFKPLLGSLDEAQKLVKKLNIAGAVTPYEFSDIADIVGNMLPALKGNSDKALAIFSMLGDTAGGNLDRLQRISLGYNKTLLKQKVTLEGLNIIAEAGVPIFNEMAKVMYGNSDATQRLFKAITDGNVPMSAMEKAFVNMTSKGGMFFGGMNDASKTFSGVMSTLKDNVNMAFAEIGKAALPILNEYAVKASEVAGKVLNWAVANKELIKLKVTEWATKIINAAKFLYNNFDKIVRILKIYIIVLIALKVISIAVAAVQFVLSVRMGLVGAATLTSTAALQGNTVALIAYWARVIAATVAMKTITAAQWLWNAAMTANPIGLLIVGIAALIGLVAIIIKHWDSWGASVAFALGPLGAMISIFKTIYNDWDLISKAFKDGGITGAFKAIGRSIMSALLYPLQQVLEIVGKLTGNDWAQKAAKGIEGIRNGMYGSDLNQTSENAVKGDASAFTNFSAINPKLQQKQMMEQTINTNKTTKNLIQLDVNANNASAKVRSNSGAIPVTVTSTRGQNGN